MKIGVWLDDTINPTAGGGFSYLEQLLILIDDYQFDDTVEVLFISRKKLNYNLKKELLVLDTVSKTNKSYAYKLVFWLAKYMSFFKLLKSKMLSRRKAEINKKDIAQLIKTNVDVIYYTSQMQKQIANFPFISTNWDLGHLSMFPFPEVANEIELKIRNHWYTQELPKAKAVFVESEAGKQELINHILIPEKQIKVIPIFPGAVVDQNVSIETQKSILEKYNLEKDNYFYYPAQYWAHKNHLNLISAFSKLLVKNSRLQLIFTGSDKGFLSTIKQHVEELQISEYVNFLGFVEKEEVYTFYKNALALVMPTFLGPTNMPLLEARSLGCPVICSHFEGHKEQLGNGAMYFDPHSIDQIYEAMEHVLNTENRKNIKLKAQKCMSNSKFNKYTAIESLAEYFFELSVS